MRHVITHTSEAQSLHHKKSQHHKKSRHHKSTTPTIFRVTLNVCARTHVRKRTFIASSTFTAIVLIPSLLNVSRGRRACNSEREGCPWPFSATCVCMCVCVRVCIHMYTCPIHVCVCLYQGTSSRTGAVKVKGILGLPGGQSQNLKGRFRATRRKHARIKLKLYFRAARRKM